MSKFLDIDVLNYAISNLTRQIDKTFLKKKVLFNVTPAYYRLFNSVTDNPSDKLTVIANGLTPTTGQVTSDTVRFITKNPSIYAVGAEVVFVEEVMTPKFDNVIGLDEQELNDIKALTPTNRQDKYSSNILFIVDDTKLVFYDRTLDTFTDCTSGEKKTIPNWKVNHDYVVGDKVNNDDIIYKCIKDHHSDLVDFKNDEDNWIIELDKYFSLSKDQYDQMVTDGLITNNNKELFIVNNGTDIASENATEKFVGTFTGDGVKTEFLAQHDLNTKDINVTFYDSTGELCYFNYELTSENVITIKPDVLLKAEDGEFKVIIIG